MVNEGWLEYRTIIIDTRPATILVLTYKAQIRARKLDPRIGRRIDKEVARQARHDLIASWVAVWFLIKKNSFIIDYPRIQMWSERLLRKNSPENKGWPDIAIELRDEVLLHIEVERTRKTKPEAHYHFLKKLEHNQELGIETVVVFEKRSQALLFIEDLNRAEQIGINSWIENAYTKEFRESKNDDRELFCLKLMVGIWDHEAKDRNFSS